MSSDLSTPDGGSPDRIGLNSLGCLLPGLEVLKLSEVWAGIRAGCLSAIQGTAGLGIGSLGHQESKAWEVLIL